MPDRQNVHEELRTLRDELGRKQQTAAAPDLPGENPAPASRPETISPGQWRELEKALSEIADNAEEVVAKHPLAAVLGAFVLGVAVGRLTGRG